MSGWKIITRALHHAGGGPLPLSAFDPCDMPESSVRSAISSALAHGVMVNDSQFKGIGRTLGGQFALTELGRDWCDGRVQIVYTPTGYLGGRGRAAMVPVATWLKALPPANEIRLKGINASGC